MNELFRMKTAVAEGIELQRCEDLIFPNAEGLDPSKAIPFTRDFKYETGDIISCTYPKCGSHWMYNMIWKLVSLDNSKRGEDTALEFADAEKYDSMDSPRVIFTHFKPSRLPVEHLQNKGKLVLTLRNPKDAMVSMYHHLKDAVLLQSKQTWDEFFESYISGLVPMGSYFDYVQQWALFIKDKPTDHHVEVFFYEDLKDNPRYHIARLNRYLGFNRDQNYLENVLEATTLSALKEQDAAGKRKTFEVVRDEKGDSVIYRKGEVGGWKTYLTVAQSNTVDRMLKEKLKNGILKIKFEI